ncbi:MAG: hypothetical protein AB1797_07245 [bacterium]
MIQYLLSGDARSSILDARCSMLDAQSSRLEPRGLFDCGGRPRYGIYRLFMVKTYYYGRLS